MVTHSDEGSFWSVVKKGAEQAAKDQGVKLVWSPSNNDPEKEAQLIDAAISQKVDGLAVSVPNADAIKGSLAKATDAGIPIITLNSGADQFKALGAITHVGQDEAIAGQAAGARFKEEGAKKVLCIIHEQSNVGLNQRCDGVKQGFGGTVDNLQVKGTADVATTQTEIKSKLQADKSYDAVMALNPDIANAADDRRSRARARTPSSPRSTSTRTSPSASRTTRSRSPSTSSSTCRATCRSSSSSSTRPTRTPSAAASPCSPARASWTRATSTRSRSWRAKARDDERTVRRPARIWRLSADERLANISLTARILRRPEIGALLAAIVVAIFFWTQNPLFLQLDGIANWTDVASTIGIPAVMVALLMIGGEFDLSAGVMTGTAGLTMGMLATEVGMNIWLAIVLTLAVATAIGFLNGYMVMKTKLPSFIVTLATFFILQGANLGVTKVITDQVTVGGIDLAAGYESANKIFGGSFGSPRLQGHGAVVDRDHAARHVDPHPHPDGQLDLRRRR